MSKGVKEIRKELNSYYVNKTQNNINMNLLKDKAYKKEEDHGPNIKREEVFNNLNIYYINDTPRYKFFEEIKQEEINYLQEHGFTIADIKQLINIHYERTKNELLYIEENYDTERLEDIKDTLKRLDEQIIVNGLNNIDINNNLIF